MALVKKKKSLPINYTSEIAAKIQQRRLQILVHSFLYYNRDITLIEDRQWDKWAKELVQLQKDNPELSNKVIYAEAFKDFDGTSGFDLPYKDDRIVKIAMGLLNLRGR